MVFYGNSGMIDIPLAPTTPKCGQTTAPRRARDGVTTIQQIAKDDDVHPEQVSE
jgi:hypothetical protein